MQKMHKSHDWSFCAYLRRYDADIQSHSRPIPKWYTKKFRNLIKRIWVIIRTLSWVTYRPTETKRRRMDRRTGWIQYTHNNFIARVLSHIPLRQFHRKQSSYQSPVCIWKNANLTHWGRVTHIYASVNQSSLVQIMACRLVGAKPLSEPMLEYC